MALQNRPPVVTILGHVDHGKTTLLDYIRKTSVAAKEFGGITQAIGAYQAEINGKLITFIDTPGHAAFEKMRERGAALADIAVLVVAIDDGVMPQTVEAISHIQKSKIPMIVAINKIDLPGINTKVQIEKIKKQLADNKVMIEEYGGDVPTTLVSAKTGENVTELLETINLVAEMHELKGDKEGSLMAVVVESRLDKFKGPIATLLVRDGTLEKGQEILIGGAKCKVRGMFDFTGKNIDQAGPSVPVEVLGFTLAPQVGAALGEETLGQKRAAPIFSLIDKLKAVDTEVLNVVAKADKQGSLEAIEIALDKLNAKKQTIKIISSGTGDITQSDVDLAAATKAIVLGFNVSVGPTAAKLAEIGHVLIRVYNIIYELLEEIEDVAEGMIKLGIVEEVLGRAQIVAEFAHGKGEKIAGCKVVEGTISKGPKVRLVRGEDIIGESRVKAIKRLKEEVSKVEIGQECGMLIDPQVDFEIGDMIESYRTL